MAAPDDKDDFEARKARADAIRRARDKRAAELSKPASKTPDVPAVPAPGPSKGTAGEAEATPNGADSDSEKGPNADSTPGTPNYVDWINKKMRRPSTE